ncbi:ATP-binding protein [Bradyrhizobium sp. Arg314]
MATWVLEFFKLSAWPVELRALPERTWGVRIDPPLNSPPCWPANETLASAILDRTLHHCHVIQTDGPTYPLRHIEQRLMAQIDLT